MSDYIHPTVKGYTLYGRHIVEYIQQLTDASVVDERRPNHIHHGDNLDEDKMFASNNFNDDDNNSHGP